MKTVLYIHHSGLMGGAGVSMMNTVLALGRNNHVIVYVPDDPADILEALQERCKNQEHIQIIPYKGRIGAITYYSGGDGLTSPRLWYRGLLIVKQFRRWNNVIRKLKPDVVVVNSKILCWMSCLPAMKKTRSLCYVRETIAGSADSGMNKLIRRLLDRFSGCVFISQYDLDREDLKKAKAYVVHNYVDAKQFNTGISRKEACDALGLKSEDFHALYVGGVSAMKGFDVAVKAVCSEDAHGIQLLICGSNFDEACITKDQMQKEYVSFWRQRLEEELSADRIHLYGRQKDMSMYYAASDVVIFPMRSPHQARPVIEAGVYGKPVIISDFENIREFVTDQKNGILVPSEDAEALKKALCMLRDHPEWCESMGKENRKNTMEKHDREKSIRSIIGIVDQSALN